MSTRQKRILPKSRPRYLFKTRIQARKGVYLENVVFGANAKTLPVSGSIVRTPALGYMIRGVREDVIVDVREIDAEDVVMDVGIGDEDQSGGKGRE